MEQAQRTHKTKVKDIARDLIKLYAARREEKGHAFAPDSYMQHELRQASYMRTLQISSRRLRL